MNRRIALAAVVSAVAVCVVPAHAAGRGSGCLTIADPAGDAHAPSQALYQPPQTPGVDIRSVTLRSDGDRLVGAVTVHDITQQPVSSTSTRVAVDFVLQGWAFTLFYDVSPVPESVAAPLYYAKGIEVFDEIVSDNLQASVVGNTVTMSVSYAELESLRGKQVRGQRLTDLAATTHANYTPKNGFLWPHQPYDTAAAPRGVAAVLGAACRQA